VSPINGVTDYYNIHGNYNAAALGVQIQLPFLDAARRARSQESVADASRAVHEASLLRSRQGEEHLRLLQSLAELSIKAELASVDKTIAEEQLKATLLQLESSVSQGRPMTPKDEQSARLQERQKYVDMLDAQAELQKSQIYLLRQTNQLERWFNAARQAP
jgi:hypothetical protein